MLAAFRVKVWSRMTAENEVATETKAAEEAEVANGKGSDRKVSPSPRKASAKEADVKKPKAKSPASSRSRSRSRSRLVCLGNGVLHLEN